MYNEQEIHTGLLNNEFFLEYLPIVNISTGQCIGAEALIRWRKECRIIPPLEFIPNIEGTILSGLVTYWVIDMVAEELGHWLHETSEVHIGINVPPELFGRGGILYAVHKSNLIDITDKIVIEITERGVPDKLGLEALNHREWYTNVLIALDDAFVSPREANLIVLNRLNIDIVKIDKSYTDRILRNDWPTSDDEQTLRLLKETRFTVIFEGIEDSRQVEVLRNEGINFGQGWYFSHPLSAEKFKKYFIEHSKHS